MSSLASNANNGADEVPPNEFREFIRAVLKEELHAVVHEGIPDLQAQQTCLKEQQAAHAETMSHHMDRIHETLARFEKKMMRGIQGVPYDNGRTIEPVHVNGRTIEPVILPSSEIAESELEEDEASDGLSRARPRRYLDRAQCTFISELDEEEMAEIEEKKDLNFKMALIDKIPNQALATCLKHLLTFLEGLKEPERTSCAAKIEQSKPFYLLSIMFVVADQLMTISATNRAAATLDAHRSDIYINAERIMLGWFALELFLKLFVHRHYFFILDHWQTNWLDLFLVTYSAFEQLGISLSFMRALRIFKLAKVIRLLKALKEVRDLRVMMDCLLSTWFALFWAVVLIGFITYMFALVFVQSITQHMIENRDTLDPNVRQVVMARFGSVQQAIVSLCKIFFGGFDWGDMYDALVQVGPLSASLGVFFALFFSISVWNIVGSIFVEKVMDTAKPHPHEVLKDARIQSQFDYSAMKQFFDYVDTDDDGSITPKEWQMIVEQGGLQEFMALRDVDLRDSADIKAFFALAQQERCSKDPDKARGDSVPTEALMQVFLKVKGQASKLQVETMLHELRTRQGQMMQILGLLRQQPFLTNERVDQV